MDVIKKALLFFFLTTFEIIYSKAALLLENFSKNLLDFTPGFFLEPQHKSLSHQQNKAY